MTKRQWAVLVAIGIVSAALMLAGLLRLASNFDPRRDPLWPALAAAYVTDTHPMKADHARVLADLYRVASAEVEHWPAATVGEVSDAMAGAAQQRVPLPALTGVRQLLAADLSVRIAGDRNVPLTKPLRTKCTGQFRRVARLLEALADE